MDETKAATLQPAATNIDADVLAAAIPGSNTALMMPIIPTDSYYANGQLFDQGYVRNKRYWEPIARGAKFAIDAWSAWLAGEELGKRLRELVDWTCCNFWIP